MTMGLANVLYAVAAVLLAYAVLFLIVHLPVFPLRHVDVSGVLSHVNREQVQLIVQREMRGNFFTVDIQRVRTAFEKLPWVRTVSVRRRWPDRLEVVLEEHVALARWGNLALVNTYGEVFRAASNASLPVFIGPTVESAREIAHQYGHFRKTLEPIHLKPAQIVLNARLAWQLRLDSGLVVELGREKVAERLEKFAKVYDRTVQRLPEPVNYVDLRYPNGFAVRYPNFKGPRGGGAGAKPRHEAREGKRLWAVAA
jgi:cell division protein FtsQ